MKSSPLHECEPAQRFPVRAKELVHGSSTVSSLSYGEIQNCAHVYIIQYIIGAFFRIPTWNNLEAISIHRGLYKDF